MSYIRSCAAGIALLTLLIAKPAGAQLVEIDEFNPGLGQIVSLTYAAETGLVWVYPSFGSQIFAFMPDGTPAGNIARPGGSANDADLDILTEPLTIGTTAVAAGALLYFDGESGVTEIYAIDQTTGTVLASLVTDFGASHVVGGAFHPGRDTFFLLQDRQPGGDQANRVAEIDPVTGLTLNSFVVTDSLPGFSVNFGDVEVIAATGNLFVVSSDESSFAVFSPDGLFLCELPLPPVGPLSGVGIDDTIDEVYVGSTSGVVTRMQLIDADSDGAIACLDNCSDIANPLQIDTNGDGIGNVCDPDIAGPGGVGVDDCSVNFSDLNALKASFFSQVGSPAYNPDADLAGAGNTPDGAINFADLNVMKLFFFGPPGPSAQGCN